MKLNKLLLHNFGIYSGSETICFENNKPVVLLGGMNGHGKTTILEAILLALYGRRSFAVSESHLSFPNYLAKYVNTVDASRETFIKLSFSLDDSLDEGNSISVMRSWKLRKNPTPFETYVLRDGQHDPYLSENWDMFVETILPCALSPLFFFDGEKIADLANTDDDEGIKKSIRTLLGIDVIDQAIADTKKIIVNRGKAISSNEYLKSIAALDKEVKKAEEIVKNKTATAGKTDIDWQRATQKLQQKEDAFIAAGGKAVNSRAELLNKKKELESQLCDANLKLIEIMSDDSPLLLVLPLLEKIQQQAKIEREQRGLDIAISQLPAIFQKYVDYSNSALNIDDLISYVKANNQVSDPVYNLSEEGYIRLYNLRNSILNVQRAELARLSEKRSQLISEISRIENHLAVYIDESATSKMYKEILELTAKVSALEQQKEAAEKEVEIARLNYEAINSQHLKLIEKAVEVMEEDEDLRRIVSYSDYVIKVLQEYRIRLQEKKVENLSSTMTYCFKSIVSKQDLIDLISIDPNTLDFSYYNKTGEPVYRSALSAGEKQLLIISMLWALAICSNKDFPVIVDTPLARLDSVHRESLIKNYFSKASKQVILLSTDSEIFGNYYTLLKPFVDHEITLAYDEENRKSYIQEGYFGGSI